MITALYYHIRLARIPLLMNFAGKIVLTSSVIYTKMRGWTGGGGGTGKEGAESGVEGAESGVERAGSGSRGGGKRGNCGRGSEKIGGRNCFFTRKFIKNDS